MISVTYNDMIVSQDASSTLIPLGQDVLVQSQDPENNDVAYEGMTNVM